MLLCIRNAMHFGNPNTNDLVLLSGDDFFRMCCTFKFASRLRFLLGFGLTHEISYRLNNKA
jgi:hypothetical protein